MMNKSQKIKKLCLITKLVIFISLFLGIFSCQPKKLEQSRVFDKNYREPIKKGREILRTFKFTNFIPGISISVSHNNKIIWSEGIGLASEELKVLASRKTKFRIGNTSQMFTAFTLAKLQEEGLLDLHDSFYDYIPEYPRKEWDFSPLLLGVNAAGFPESDTEKLITKNKFRTLKDYISFYENEPLSYAPDSYFMKSDYSIGLLGILAEEVSGKHFYNLVKETILDTLALNSTSIENPFRITENRSNAYQLDYMSQLINAQFIDLRCAAPALGFISTADDLNKAGQAILEPGFFTQETLDLFLTPHHLKEGNATNRGFGSWLINDEKGRKIYLQIGSVKGGSSIMMIYPEQKLIISMCSNINDEFTELPAKKIANIFLEQIDPRKEANTEKK